MRKLIIITSVLFCAMSSSAQFGIFRQFQLSGKSVNRISNDSALTQNSDISLVTEWAVKNYFDNRLQSVTIRTGNSFPVSSQAEMLALTAIVGDVAIRSDVNKSFILGAIPASTLGNWRELLSPGQLLSFAGRTGIIVPQSGDYNYSQISGTPAPVVILPGSGVGVNQSGNTFTITGNQEPVISGSNSIKSYWNGYKTFVPLNTDSIPEGSSQFFTVPRVLAALPKARTSVPGIVYPGKGLKVDSITGELSTKAALLTPRSVPFVASDGELTEDNTGLSWDGYNLVVGKSGFYNESGIQINGGRGYMSASGNGTIIGTTGGQPMDASKKIRFRNSSTDYGAFQMVGDSSLEFSSNSTFRPIANYWRSLGTALFQWRDVYARAGYYDSIFIKGTYFDPATGGGGGTSYTLPPASSGALGGVKIGAGLSIDGAGVVSNPFNKTVTDTYYEPVFGKNTAFNKSFGTGAGQVAEGSALATKVDKVTGSSLITDAEKTKLSGAASQQALQDSITNVKANTLNKDYKDTLYVNAGTGQGYDSTTKRFYNDTVNVLATRNVTTAINQRLDNAQEFTIVDFDPATKLSVSDTASMLYNYAKKGSGGVDASKVNISDTANMLLPYAKQKLLRDSVLDNTIAFNNIDNTSDISKPVSTAMQSALNLKANDADVVKLSGNQSINGNKTFNGSMSITPTTAGLLRLGKSFAFNAYNSNAGGVSNNVYFDGTTWRYINDGAGMLMWSGDAGEFSIYSAIPGLAGTEAPIGPIFTVNPSGMVEISDRLRINAVYNGPGSFLTRNGTQVWERTPAQTLSDIGAQSLLTGTGYVKSTSGVITYETPTPGTWTTVNLASDVINNNATANTLADVTGLSFAVTSGKTYRFKFTIYYSSAVTTTGSRWSINGPTATFLAYRSNYTLTTASKTFNEALGTYGLPAASNATSNATGNMVTIEGTIKASATGTVIARFASEVASSAITALGAYSYVEYIQID